MDVLLGLLQRILLVLQLGTTQPTLPQHGDLSTSEEDLKTSGQTEELVSQS